MTSLNNNNNMVYSPRDAGDGGPPYYLMRRNKLTGDMDQVYSSMDWKEVQTARRMEGIKGLSYSSPYLEIWSTRTEGFGSGIYGDE